MGLHFYGYTFFLKNGLDTIVVICALFSILIEMSLTQKSLIATVSLIIFFIFFLLPFIEISLTLIKSFRLFLSLFLIKDMTKITRTRSRDTAYNGGTCLNVLITCNNKIFLYWMNKSKVCSDLQSGQKSNFAVAGR